MKENKDGNKGVRHETPQSLNCDHTALCDTGWNLKLQEGHELLNIGLVYLGYVLMDTWIP